ncbi:hypothetical protein IQ06DRAFT_229691, partial [Phaeosphaeriaceae sp. SRC1lsM3a]
RLALLVQRCVIGAADVEDPLRLQKICGSAMRKQDLPEVVRSPCARVQIARFIDSIGACWRYALPKDASCT